MFKRIAIAVAISAALAGCGTEERPYDVYERPAEEITTASLDTESLWLYMPSTGEAPRYAMTQRGFFQGDPKLVTLKFDKKNGIFAEEVDRDKLSADSDSRWDADINKAPVLRIPGEFRQYRCALNAYDECTNKEEVNEDEDLLWSDATHFVPEYEKIESIAQDSVRAWFTASNVEETADPRVVSYEYNPEEGVINVEVERTFTADPEDQYQFGPDLKDYSFKTKFYYSLVKLDKLTTPGYEPVYYQGRDRAFYGFFNDAKEKSTDTGETNVQGSVYSLLNRFAPGKSSIDYYLSDSYHDDGNELYKQVTLDSIADINTSLQGTGVPPIRIVNPDSKAGVHTGDLRYNVLNLITDPVDSGLLGYGPSATNPLTGEIVHAHVNQYAGVIRSATRRVWNELVMRYNRQEIVRPDEYTPTGNTAADEESVNTEVAAFAEMLAADRGAPIGTPEFSSDEISLVAGQVLTPQMANHNVVDDHAFNTRHPDLAIQSFNKDQQRLKNLSEQNAYSIDFMWLSTQSKGLIDGIDYAAGGYFADDQNLTLKDWNSLSKAQQSSISDAVAAHMFRSTLIHELGHNLGLRHNFMGSVDKANFYSQAEAKSKGMDKVPAYSSIMDYAASVFDELPNYGKYDIAALRFGYGRQVEANLTTEQVNPETSATERVTEKKYLSLSNLDAKLAQDFNAFPRGTVQYMRDNYQDSDELKEIDLGDNQTLGLALYNFCTDEHTTTSVLCNRFDEGTDIKELTEFRIQKYRDSYDTMNKRNGRQSFYQFHQYNYFLARWNEFLQIRDVIENVEEIDYLFARYLGVSNTNGRVFSEIYANSCRGVDRSTMNSNLKNLCDTYDAAVTAADFFLEVMTTPDMVCELEEKSGVPGVPNRYRFATLSDLWRTYGPGMSDNRDIPTSCYDDELVSVLANQQNEIVVRSQTRDGHIEASLQANNPHQSSVSSVDLLGTWPDKLLAAQMLVRRDSPFVDTENSSLALIDIEGKVEEIFSHLSYLTGNPTSRQPVFVDNNGDYVKTVDRYVPALGKMVDQAPSYLWPMKRFFGLTGGDQLNYWFDASTPDTPTPMLRALLTNLHTHAYAREYGLSDNAVGLIDGISLRKAGPYVDTTDALTFSWKADNFVASRRNLLAKAMATRALYTDDQKAKVERLGKVGYRVRNALNVFRETHDHHESRLVAIADADALKLMKETTGFSRFFLIRNSFKEYTDADTGTKCRRLEVDSETEAQRLSRKCNSQASLENALQSIDRVEEDRLPALYELATIFGDAIASNNGISSYAKDKEVYDYDSELLRLWSTNKYVEYRRAFEQFPLLN
ncbi:protein of unknown function [Ferrimonas sediminum]|uniref:EcxA zinc-binding domain-containing protein n=1 Tax=Ferrimonas sediminum TaxID=718193 RepID=A0A1G8Q0T3_9GAMM|nr:zinc-dependent metalloprotease [Ferrimonas sediminum]SDI98126.1 protein of unknown function [Ferrimonas sediminum]